MILKNVSIANSQLTVKINRSNKGDSMLLPSIKSTKETNLARQVTLIYGRPKIGKSTFCSYYDHAVFFATEPGLNHLEVFKVNINNWHTFLEACGEIAGGKHEFKTIIIDTIDNLLVYCSDYVCKENDISHPADLPHGKGWSLITAEFTRAMVKLYGLGYGVVLVGHTKQEEVETKTKKYSRFTIDISGKNQNVILNGMDLILFMDSEMKDGVEVGVLRTKPSQYYEAGDKSKLLPESIYYPLDNPKVAYDAVIKAFNVAK